MANVFDRQFRIYDISDASSPDLIRELGSSVGQEFSLQMEWLDHRLFILDTWGGGLRYLDVSSPLEPFHEGYMNTDLGSWTHEFIVTPQFLYAVGDSGFSIISHTVPVGLSHFRLE